MTTIVPGKPKRPIIVENGGRIPSGGTVGQALVKSSGLDYQVEWGTATASAAWGAITGTLADQTDLQAALDAKQATLVSGTNIKTLNGSTILGSGDLVISASATWGGITGTLSDQTDLQTALNAKLNSSAVSAYGLTLIDDADAATARTTLGLAAVAASGSASDLSAGTLPAARFNDTAHGTRGGGTLHANVIAGGAAGFMTGADKTKLDAITGTNTGDQTITLTSDVTGSGTGSFATTIANNAVSFAKMADIGTDTLIGRDTASTGDPEAITVTGGIEFSGSGSIRTSAFTGDVTKTAGGTALTLATVNSNVGSFGSATQVATFTVNAKGLTTAAGNTTISIPATAISDSTAAGRAVVTAASATAQTALFDVFTTSAKGLAPASGGGTTNFLRADGTWAAPPGGGGGGSGDVVGPASATDNAIARFDSTTGKLIQNSAVTLDDNGVLTLPSVSTPPTPAADNVNVFGRKVGGRMLLGIEGPSGLDTALNPHLGRNKVAMWQATGNAGTDTNFGFVAASTGTSTTENVATTNIHTYMRRRSWRVTTASTTAVAGFRGSAQMWTVGASTAGLGGFHLVIRWGPATGVSTSTHRAFMGMRASVAAPTDVNPSTLLDICGMGYDAADANVQFMHNDGSGTATKIDLGGSFPKPTVDLTTAYEIAMFAPPGTTQSVSYEVTNLGTGAVASGTVTTDLPSTSTFLNPYGYMSVGGTSSVIGIMVSSLYCESDY